MRYHSVLRTPKKEEQQVPDSTTTTNSSSEFNGGDHDHQLDIMDDLERILGIDEDRDYDDDQNLSNNMHSTTTGHELNWDFMDWEQVHFFNGDQEGEEENIINSGTDIGSCFFEDESYYKKKVVIKREDDHHQLGFWDDIDDEEKRVQLNLNLNYQQVLDAWSDRGSLWADDCSSLSSMAATNANYMGEVPVMEEEGSSRREASVQRYKEKRQTRLFSKKIRYQVRKLNADKRPRLKGRFVKRVS